MNNLVGIHAVNSVDFVRAVFDVYRSEDVVVIVKQGGVLPFKREIHPRAGGGWLDIRQELITTDKPAQVVFSSGTEGAPKAILLSHRALADVVSRLNHTMRVDDSIREYVGVPVTYSFGLGRCRAVAAVGGRCYLPDNGFNPSEIARMLASEEINAISAVPTLWRTILNCPDVIGTLGRRVKWIEIGSQFMSREEKEGMKALFPNATIVQHYGLTEASRTTLLTISDTEGDRLASVGRVVGDVQVRIAENGKIAIRGPHVALGQIVDGQVQSLTDADGWLTTNDLGRLEDGQLYYLGRADDIINCGGVKVNPEILQERISSRMGSGNRIGVSRFSDPLRGEGVFVAIEVGSGIVPDAIRSVTLEELLELGIDAKSAVRVQEVPAIPRTDTGKVKRKELSQMCSPLASPTISTSSGEADSIRRLFALAFPGVAIQDKDTFRSLGGDSLNYVQMIITLEKRLGFVPTGWDNMPVKELELAKPQRGSSLFSWIETSIFLRVMAILGVVATHSGVEILGGGTLLLFVLIGFNVARFKTGDFVAGSAWPWIGKYLGMVLVPYYAFVVLFSVWNRAFNPDLLFLYTNFVENRVMLVFPFWFVQVLVQCMLLSGLLFSIPWVRKKASITPFQFSLIVLFFLAASRLIYPLSGKMQYLHDLDLSSFIVLFWLGWTFHSAASLSQRVVVGAAGIAIALIDYGHESKVIWLILGCSALAFVSRVPVPAFLKALLNDIGAATYYIFVFNGLVIWAWQRFSGSDNALVAFCVTMIVSMSLWRVANVAIGKFKRRKVQSISLDGVSP